MLALIATLAASVLSAVAELGRAVLAALAAKMSPSLTNVSNYSVITAQQTPIPHYYTILPDLD